VKGESCNGRRDVVTEDPEAQLGHLIFKVSVENAPLFVCKKCGAQYSRNDSGKMSGECTEPTKWGRRVIQRVFEEFVHPQTRKPLDARPCLDTAPVPSKREATVRKLVAAKGKGAKQWRSKLPSDAFTGAVAPAPPVSGFDEPCDEPQEDDGWASEPENPWADDVPKVSGERATSCSVQAHLPPSSPSPRQDFGGARASSSSSVGANSVCPPSGAGSSQDLLGPSVDVSEAEVLEPTAVGGFVAFSVEERTFTKSADDLAKLKVAALLERVRAKKLGSHAT